MTKRRTFLTFIVINSLFLLAGCLFNSDRCLFDSAGCLFDLAGCIFDLPGYLFDLAGCQFDLAGCLLDSAGCLFDLAGCLFDLACCLFDLACFFDLSGLQSDFAGWAFGPAKNWLPNVCYHLTLCSPANDCYSIITIVTWLQYLKKMYTFLYNLSYCEIML